MRKLMKSMGHARQGFVTIAKEERNFKIHIIIGIVVVALCLLSKFTYLEWVAVIFAITFVLSAEILNTVVEDLCDKIEPNHHPVIGRIKDMMAGYALLVSVGAAVVGVILFARHLF